MVAKRKRKKQGMPAESLAGKWGRGGGRNRTRTHAGGEEEKGEGESEGAAAGILGWMPRRGAGRKARNQRDTQGEGRLEAKRPRFASPPGPAQFSPRGGGLCCLAGRKAGRQAGRRGEERKGGGRGAERGHEEDSGTQEGRKRERRREDGRPTTETGRRKRRGRGRRGREEERREGRRAEGRREKRAEDPPHTPGEDGQKAAGGRPRERDKRGAGGKCAGRRGASKGGAGRRGEGRQRAGETKGGRASQERAQKTHADTTQKKILGLWRPGKFVYQQSTETVTFLAYVKSPC
jgi:hypothetical protein